MDQLANAVFPLWRSVFTVEVFTDYDVRCQLTPVDGNLTVVLLEKQLPIFALDLGTSSLPLDRFKRICDLWWAKNRFDAEAWNAFLAILIKQILGGSVHVDSSHRASPFELEVWVSVPDY